MSEHQVTVNGKTYSATIHPDDNNTVFATCDELPSVAGVGDTQEEALECLAECIEVWLEEDDQ